MVSHKCSKRRERTRRCALGCSLPRREPRYLANLAAGRQAAPPGLADVEPARPAAADPVAALKDRLRGDEGRVPSLSAVAIAALTLQYREHPGWTAQLHLDNLRVACKHSDSPLASYATVRRYLRAQGMHRQASPGRATAGAIAARDRLEQREVRSFEAGHVAALWHLDFHHASRRVLTRAGAWVKPVLLGVTGPHEPASADIPMPRLSDDAVVQIHDFIGHFLDLFEARQLQHWRGSCSRS